MRNNNGQKQVSLAGVANTQNKKKKKKQHRSLKPWIAVGAAVVVLVAVVGGILLFRQPEEPYLEPEKMVTYSVTPDNIAKKVSYFALGISGENTTDRLAAVAVMCYDRKAESLSVVQVPVTTYLGKDTGYAVSMVGNVWGNPQPIQFCTVCRANVSTDEVEKKVHTVCGGAVEKQTGSSSGDLCRVFNEQYGLPIDNFLVIPRSGLAELIDGLGGVDIELSKKAKLDGETYDAGVQTLTGEAAVSYALDYNYKSTPDSDRERMLRQREVFAALLLRLSDCRLKDLYSVDKTTGSTKGVFGKLMLGEYPIRFNSTSFGKARLLGKSTDKVEDMKVSETIARFALEMGEIPLEKVTFSILPGQSAKNGSTTVYSVNCSQTIELLNEQMNPYDLTLDDTTVTAPQLVSKPSKADLETATLKDLVPEQSGMLEEEE